MDVLPGEICCLQAKKGDPDLKVLIVPGFVLARQVLKVFLALNLLRAVVDQPLS